MANNKRKTRRRITKTDTISREMPVLNDIRESLLSQQTSSVPDVKDVILPRFKRERIYNFEATIPAVNITSNTMAETDGVVNITLSVLDGYTSFTSLFDQYRIVGCRSKFVPGNSGTNAGATIYTAIDYDDGNTTSTASLVEYDTLKIAPSSAYFERSYRPKLAMAIFQNSVATGYGSSMSNQWVDSNYPSVPYYGLKYAIPANAAPASFQLLTTVYLQCKNQR
jgi:hypothetical protein